MNAATFQSIEKEYCLKFIENHPLDRNNRNNMREDFYGFYYYMECIVDVSTFSEKNLAGKAILTEQILQGIQFLFDSDAGLHNEEQTLDMLDFTTTLWGTLKASHYFEVNYTTEVYKLWLVDFRKYIEEVNIERLDSTSKHK